MPSNYNKLLEKEKHNLTAGYLLADLNIDGFWIVTLRSRWRFCGACVHI